MSVRTVITKFFQRLNLFFVLTVKKMILCVMRIFKHTAQAIKMLINNSTTITINDEELIKIVERYIIQDKLLHNFKISSFKRITSSKSFIFTCENK